MRRLVVLLSFVAIVPRLPCPYCDGTGEVVHYEILGWPTGDCPDCDDRRTWPCSMEQFLRGRWR